MSRHHTILRTAVVALGLALTIRSAAAAPAFKRRPSQHARDRLQDEARGCPFEWYPANGKFWSSKPTPEALMNRAQQELAFYGKWKDSDPGLRVPPEVLVRLISSIANRIGFIYGIDADSPAFDDALALVHDTESTVGTLSETPPDGEGPAYDGYCAVIVAEANLIVTLHGGRWQDWDDDLDAVDRAARAYAAAIGHDSPLATQFVEEAHALRARYAGVSDAYRAAVGRLEKDPTYVRLESQLGDVRQQADALRDQVGPVDGCTYTSNDPKKQPVLAQLCPIGKREDAPSIQTMKIADRYFNAFYKKYPRPESAAKHN